MARNKSDPIGRPASTEDKQAPGVSHGVASLGVRLMRLLVGIVIVLILAGLPTNAWVVLAFVLLPILMPIHARFLLARPPRSRWLFVLSGVVYVGGVVCVENALGRHEEQLWHGGPAFRPGDNG